MVGLRGARILCSAAAGSMEGELGWGCCCWGPRLPHPPCRKTGICLAMKTSRCPIVLRSACRCLRLILGPISKGRAGAQADRDLGSHISTATTSEEYSAPPPCVCTKLQALEMQPPSKAHRLSRSRGQEQLNKMQVVTLQTGSYPASCATLLPSWLGTALEQSCWGPGGPRGTTALCPQVNTGSRAPHTCGAPASI